MRPSRRNRGVVVAYLLAWSYFVGRALMSACGVAAHAMLPVFDDPVRGKVVFGIAHSLVGAVLVWLGGYRLFEKVMSVCIAFMFITVLATAVMLQPDWLAVLRGLTVPRIPQLGGQGLAWTIALIGGVGGTLTVLCYGYWIREKGRVGPEALRHCRIDLGVAYACTALFGLAVVIIGSTVEVDGKGAGLIVSLAQKLEEPLGTVGKWTFLIGAWGAMFSSLLGVWQAVPYIFSDFCGLVRCNDDHTDRIAIDTRSWSYRGYLLVLTFVPMLGLFGSFKQVQKAYAVFGAMFLPMLAVALLVLNSRTEWVGKSMRNRTATQVALVAIVLFFLVTFWFHLRKMLGG